VQVSSELDTKLDLRPCSLAGGQERATEPHQVSDEEFPEGLPAEYERMLQLALGSRPRRAGRLALAVLAILLVVASVLLLHYLSNPQRALLYFPFSVLH
jgi:hypothetical protein